MHATISEFIRRDLSSRIGSAPGLPAELTIPALARHYGVSFTPVREAIRALVSEGVLLKQGNGRVAVNPDRAPKDAEREEESVPASRALPSRSAALEAAIAGEVIGRSLRGESAYLREEAAARRHGVGRTAVRQVFGRLAGRGLIVHVPRCGWRVRAFDEKDLRAYLEVREALELKALDLARPRLDPGELRRLRAGNVPRGRAPRLDNRLHHYLVEQSGNAYIRDFFERQGAYYTTLFDYAAPGVRVEAEMARQHRAILDALLARDWPRARKALAGHIRAQQPIVEHLMRRLGRPDQSTESSKDHAR